MGPREHRVPTCTEPHPLRPEECCATGDETMLIVDISLNVTGMPVRHVHHRDFPEVRGEGETLRDCVDQLTFHLARAREHAREAWQRDAIDHAMLDLNAFQKTH